MVQQSKYTKGTKRTMTDSAKFKKQMHPTLCWKCAHVVPNRTRTLGCEWSLHNEPVPGWEATKTTINIFPETKSKKHSGQMYTQDSYRVHNCPKFLKG